MTWAAVADLAGEVGWGTTIRDDGSIYFNDGGESMAGMVTLTGQSASEPAGQRILGPLSISGTQVIGDELGVPLVLGDNTFAVPTGAVGVVIVPPTTNAVALTVRLSSNSGDTGLPISPILPTLLTFASTPTSIIVHAAAAQSSPLTLWFW